MQAAHEEYKIYYLSLHQFPVENLSYVILGTGDGIENRILMFTYLSANIYLMHNFLHN